MAGLKSLGIGLLLVALMSFAAINFAIGFASDNGGTQSLADDPMIGTYKSNLSSDLTRYSSDAENAVVAFSNSTPTVGGESLQIESTANTWRSPLSSPKRAYDATLGLILERIFGGTSSENEFRLIFAVLSAVIIFIAVLVGWAWIRGGIFD